MAHPAEQQPVDQAAELEATVAQAIEQELRDVYAKASHGFLRGRKLPKRKPA